MFVDGTKDAVDSKKIEEKISEGKAKDENNVKSRLKIKKLILNLNLKYLKFCLKTRRNNL